MDSCPPCVCVCGRSCLCFCEEGRVDSAKNISLFPPPRLLFHCRIFTFCLVPLLHLCSTPLLSLLNSSSINVASPSPPPPPPPSANTLHHAPSSPTSAGLGLLPLTSLCHTQSPLFTVPQGPFITVTHTYTPACDGLPTTHPTTASKLNC